MSAPIAPAAAPRPPAATRRGPDWAGLGLAVLLVAAALAAYSGTFSVPFLFDDGTSIAGNPSIRRLSTALFPPPGTTVSGRPVLNLSLAFNYAVSGTDVWSYHALNLAIHVLAGLAVFGIVRRTLAPRLGDSARLLGFAVALLWTVHPLATEAVTYTVQRAESLMGLFYLLTLYSFIRGAQSEGPAGIRWYAASIAACLLGMGTKEVMVSAPLVVLLYDRTFLAGGFGAALRARAWVYAGLASTWLALLFLVLSTHGRGGSAGFEAGVTWWGYGLTQLRAIVLYLRLGLWPSPLVFDYGSSLSRDPAATAACALTVALLAGATLWALARAPAIGFLGACFFAVLAPSSSILPVATEAVAEHRMYLALIPVVVLVVLGIHRWAGRAAFPVLGTLAVALAWATFERNANYRTEEAIWADAVLKRPDNERAQDNLGYILSRKPGRIDEAIAHYEAALRLKPDFVEAHYNLAYALLQKPGRINEAILHYEEAIRLRPDLPEVHYNLARALESVPGRSGEAVAQYEEAIRLRPDYAEAHYNLGFILQSMPGRLGDAAEQFEEALRLRPDNAGAHFSLGCALQATPGRLGDAVSQFEEAIRLKPDYVAARCNLGNALNSLGRIPEAIGQYAEAARLMPADATIRVNFAIILLGAPGRRDEAVENLREAVRLDPDNETARRLLARVGAEP